MAQARSPMASVGEPPAHLSTSVVTMAMGSSVSAHGRRAKTPGRGTTRGASSSGTTRVGSPLPAAGSTSMVKRSRGMAT